MFRPAPIVSNTTTVTNLSPNAGGVPTPVAGGGAAPPAAHQRRVGERRLRAGHRRAATAESRDAGGPWPAAADRRLDRIPIFRSPRGTVPTAGTRNLDMWYANIQGQGSGSVSPFAENAYGGLVGSIPAALIWSSFHGGTGGISVWQQMQMKVWSPVVRIHLHGEWDKIQEHFSAAAHGGGWFWSADVQAEFNNLRMSGGITAEIEVDTTLPNADKIQEEMNKRSDLVFQKFMDQAQKTIFDPAPFNEKPAEASGGFLGFGGGAAVKLRRDRSHLTLDYTERREMAYLQPYPVSGQLEGMHDQIKADPAAEKRYFQTVDLGDWDRKVTRVVKPVVNWPEPAQEWVGQPVAFLSAQIGYPNANGELQWDGTTFQATDPPEREWHTSMAMKKAADVSNPPPGWKPGSTYVKRKIHFTEPPSEAENPYARVQVEQNVVDLDPGDVGRATEDINLEVRVDNVGSLTVSPIFLNVDLETAKQIVEVTLRARGTTTEGKPRDPVKFTWGFGDQINPRHWMLFTGQPDFVPKYDYQVRVIVKGSIMTKGQEWTGPWVEASSSGPMMISVPTPSDPGVTTKEIVDLRPGITAGAATSGSTSRTRPPSREVVRVGAERGAGASKSTKLSGYAMSGSGTRGANGGDNGGENGTKTSRASRSVSVTSTGTRQSQPGTRPRPQTRAASGGNGPHVEEEIFEHVAPKAGR